MHYIRPSYKVGYMQPGREERWSNQTPARQLRHITGDAPRRAALSTSHVFQARDSRTYMLRRVAPADTELLAEFMYALSSQTRWLRFMTARPPSREAVRSEVARMLAGAAGRMITLVATEANGPGALVAVAELACDLASGTGEVGLVVSDEAQRKGIGAVLLRQIVQIAQELGLGQLHGDLFAENYAMRGLIRSLQLPYTATIQAGEMHVVLQVPA